MGRSDREDLQEGRTGERVEEEEGFPDGQKSLREIWEVERNGAWGGWGAGLPVLSLLGMGGWKVPYR